MCFLYIVKCFGWLLKRDVLNNYFDKLKKRERGKKEKFMIL